VRGTREAIPWQSLLLVLDMQSNHPIELLYAPAVGLQSADGIATPCHMFLMCGAWKRRAQRDGHGLTVAGLAPTFVTHRRRAIRRPRL